MLRGGSDLGEGSADYRRAGVSRSKLGPRFRRFGSGAFEGTLASARRELQASPAPNVAAPPPEPLHRCRGFSFRGCREARPEPTFALPVASDEAISTPLGGDAFQHRGEI
jgi:hypothetical protein